MELKRISRALAVIAAIGIAAAIPVTIDAASGPAALQSLEVQEHYFDCMVRVFVVEPDSRYDDNGGYPFGFGLLDVALDEAVTLENDDPYTNSFVWNGTAAGFGDITQNNIMVIAVVSTADSYTGYSDPPSSGAFDVHEVQATAAALPGETGTEDASGSYTHTVFLIEGTQHTCVNCPLTNLAMDDLWNGGDYQFYYAAFVEDMNTAADDHLHSQYNVVGFPTVYTDGGLGVNIGGDADSATYGAAVLAASTNPVHDLDLSVTLNWLGSAQLGIEVSVASNELTNNAPPAPSTPDGPEQVTVGTPVSFVSSATDVDGDSLWYQWCVSGFCFDWYGPYASGDTTMITRTFGATGNVGVYLKCKDKWASSLESDSLTITVVNYVCGDSNADGVPNITDAVSLIQYIFAGGPAPQPLIAGDCNCDGVPNITDAVYLVQYIFAGGPAPCADCP
ncbi:MAG: dockerin type I domain-containing protein [bacterium]